MITMDLLLAGYRNGIVRIVDRCEACGAVCQIGDGWFYFGGCTAEEMTAEEYVDCVPEADIVSEIFDALESFRVAGSDFEDEYLYYELYMKERMKEISG